MKYKTIEDLEWDVINEAIALKQHATKEELDRLDFITVNAYSIVSCIYGQMTGSCHSDRAIELINKCAVSFIATSFPLGLGDVQGINDFCNNIIPNSDEAKAHNINGRTRYFSPIEVYIVLANSNKKALIDFLQGKTKSLNLEK